MRKINYTREVRQALKFTRQYDAYYPAIAPLLALEIGNYSEEECLLAVWNVRPRIPMLIGPVASMLYARCNRGKETLDKIMAAYAERLAALT